MLPEQHAIRSCESRIKKLRSTKSTAINAENAIYLEQVKIEALRDKIELKYGKEFMQWITRK